MKSKDLTKMYDAMLTGDVENFELELVNLLVESIIVYDKRKPSLLCSLGKFREPKLRFGASLKNFYHGFLLGTLINMKKYIIKSNRKSGKGRSDIIIRYPNRRGVAVVL